ncbi:efflux RND transporter periplasmic adaptor subunit [Thiomicrorhabdus sp.]|uniref:efflux RND transporter periplasmic adaptor subunit n=1 Tax=Thiomicrorhabdus sp. TaxID=2039724 RepID=UPI0029C75B2C|nr:efflux RND transporter periplasmic adaptor subunit [Thiomicrorhabdus sp.]
MKQTRKLFAVSALVAALGLTACQQEAPVAPQEAVQTIAAHVATVSLGEVPMNTVVPGAVVPDQRARIASRLMGYIKNSNVKVGQTVKRGQLLFSIDSADIRSQISQANSAYQQAKAALTDAKLDYDRFTKLYEDDSVSKQQYDKIRLQYSVAQENLAAARSGLRQAESQLKYANVTAPFDGVVVEKMAAAGDLAAPGNPIVVIENLKSLSVQTEVAADLYAVLRQGDEAEVMIDGQNKPLVGTIYTLVSSANPKTRTHTVKLSLPDINNVNSGTFARVSFTRGVRQAMMIPKSAIVMRAGIEGVFVVEDGHAFFHMVRTGMSTGDMVEVQAGLALGEQIVVDNNQSMLNGDQVDVISAGSKAEGA